MHTCREHVIFRARHVSIVILTQQTTRGLRRARDHEPGRRREATAQSASRSARVSEFRRSAPAGGQNYHLVGAASPGASRQVPAHVRGCIGLGHSCPRRRASPRGCGRGPFEDGLRAGSAIGSPCAGRHAEVRGGAERGRGRRRAGAQHRARREAPPIMATRSRPPEW